VSRAVSQDESTVEPVAEPVEAESPVSSVAGAETVEFVEIK
jgi:hypothetical protein